MIKNKVTVSLISKKTQKNTRGSELISSELIVEKELLLVDQLCAVGQ